MIFSQMENVVNQLPKDNNTFLLIGGTVGGLLFLYIAYRFLFRQKGIPDLEKGQRENLADYPPAPNRKGSHTLTVHQIPARIRLVVFAPVGKQNKVALDEAESLLEDLMPGLGGLIQIDKPRIKIWPAQLSIAGFASVFHRLVQTPTAPTAKSNWVLFAGDCKINGKPYLLGFAVYADNPVQFGQMHLQAKDWHEILRIGRVVS